MKRWLMAAICPALVGLATGSSAQNGPYIFDIPKLYLAIFQKWTEALPNGIGSISDWLGKLNGTASPIRDISVGGGAMKFGTTCKPHDCAGNIAGVLFPPQQSRIVAVVRLTGKSGVQSLLVMGPVSNSEFACIRRLVDDHQLTVC